MVCHYLSLSLRVSDQGQHQKGCAIIKVDYRLDISDSDKEMDSSVCVVKAKALISCTVTAQLICTFVLACTKKVFSWPGSF